MTSYLRAQVAALIKARTKAVIQPQPADLLPGLRAARAMLDAITCEHGMYGPAARQYEEMFTLFKEALLDEMDDAIADLLKGTA